MVYREAIGYTNVHRKGCGKSFLAFSKYHTVRGKTVTIFCKRRTFVPTNNHRLCSDHFTTDKIQQDPAQLEQYGYDRARIGLKRETVPDGHLHINKENESVVLPPRPQEACVKRRKGWWK